ncbi:hypothetical protein, partial [Streptomyces scabiei]|uniref:hypothetical protein n=1 Tax=Streptomyces scabiei TaxID=1930 RepID=UPI0038F6D91D
NFSFLIFLFATGLILSSCKKGTDYKNLWQAELPPVTPISETTCLSGAIKGTMLAGKTYTVCGDIFVNQTDTLFIQPGVTINFGLNTSNGNIP